MLFSPADQPGLNAHHYYLSHSSFTSSPSDVSQVQCWHLFGEGLFLLFAYPYP